MSNVVLGLNSVSGGLASRALLPGITYPMTCNPALTQMRLRRSLRHFSSNVHLTLIDSISFFKSIYIYIYMSFLHLYMSVSFFMSLHQLQINVYNLFILYISSRVVSAPGHFCIAALYKFLLYCIVLSYITSPIDITFYPRDAMLARVFAIATCLSVCLSVTRRYCD